MKAFFLFLCVPVFGHTLSATAAVPPEEANPVIEMEVALDPGRMGRLQLAKAVPLYDTRAAKRTLAMLDPAEPVTVIAIDRFGLKVRGRGVNGPLTGWIGQKSAFGPDAVKLERLQAFYDRQVAIERFIAQKRPAIGMTLRELTRIYGPATSHQVAAEGSQRRETAVWTKSEKVDLNDTLDLGTNVALLKVDVETGRITVGLTDGAAHSIDVNVPGVAAEIPTVGVPIAPPFELASSTGTADNAARGRTR